MPSAPSVHGGSQLGGLTDVEALARGGTRAAVTIGGAGGGGGAVDAEIGAAATIAGGAAAAGDEEVTAGGVGDVEEGASFDARARKA